MLIRMVTLANLINKVNPMPNYILIMPYIVVSSYTLILSLLNAKNWPYFIINYLDTSIVGTISRVVTCRRGTSVVRSLKLLALPHPRQLNRIILYYLQTVAT